MSFERVRRQTWKLCQAPLERPSQSACLSSAPRLLNDLKGMLRAEAQDFCELEVLHHIQTARSGLDSRQALL